MATVALSTACSFSILMHQRPRSLYIPAATITDETRGGTAAATAATSPVSLVKIVPGMSCKSRLVVGLSLVLAYCAGTAYGFSAQLPPPWSPSSPGGNGGEGNFRFFLYSSAGSKPRKRRRRSAIDGARDALAIESDSKDEHAEELEDEDNDIQSPGWIQSELERAATSLPSSDKFYTTDGEFFVSNHNTRDYSAGLTPLERATFSPSIVTNIKATTGPARAFSLPSPSVSDISTTSADLIRHHLTPLLRMFRLAHLPGVLLFHVVGAHSALHRWASVSGTAFNLYSILMRPGMLMTLASIVLVATTSVAVNSYYDARLGVNTDHSNPIVSGIVPKRIAKRFLAYVYAALAAAEAFVPGWPARIAIVFGGLSSFYYTNYIKPLAWWKNIFCAGLVACGQLTSGVAALHIANGGLVPAVSEVTTTLAALWRPVLVFFLGVMGREIALDIDDAEVDARAGIRTVPVVHGKRFASRTVLTLSVTSVLVAAAGPALSLILSSNVWRTAFRSAIESGSIPAAVVSTLRSVLSTPDVKRLALVLLGGGIYVNAARGLASTEGEDSNATQRVISRSMIGALMVWAGFV